MYRFLVILFACILFVPDVLAARSVIAQSPYYNRYDNPYFYRDRYNNHRGYYLKNRYTRHNLSELNALEKQALNRTYKSESELARLQRLELQEFGAIQQGDFDTRYDRVRSAILSRPKAHKNSSVWSNIGDYLFGQMTGFTPPIDNFGGYSYNPYSTNCGNNSFSEYSNPLGGHGYRVNNYGTSSGMGITILD